MRLPWLVLKEVRIALRDPKTVFLMFFAPLVIMLLVGAMFFSETGIQPETMKQVPVGMCNLDEGPHGSVFSEQIAALFDAKSAETDCVEQMEKELSLSHIRAYLIIPANFSASLESGRHVDIFLKTDNAKPDISSIITSVSQGMAYSAAEKMGTAFVQATWDTLTNMSSSLALLSDSLEESQSRIETISHRTSETMEGLQSIDTADLLRRIQSSRISIEGLVADTAALRESVKNSSQEVSLLSESMAELQSSVSDLDNGITLLRSDITSIQNDLDATYSDAFCEEADSFEYLNQTFVNRWRSTCANIVKLNSSLSVLDADLEQQRVYLLELNATASATQLRLEGVQLRVAELDERLGALDELEELNSSLSYMEAYVGELGRIQGEATANLAETSGIMETVGSNITALREGAITAKAILDSLVSRDPASIITPLSLKTSSLFENIRYLDAMFPAILAIILMFVTILFSAVTIIREKKSGTLRRVLLTPTRPMEFALGKISLVLLIAMFQAAFLMLVAWAIFSVRLNWGLLPYAFAVVALFSVTFSSIGMIIAALSDSENTALLGSLVVCIPMLFLSGVFFPRELMISPMALLSLASPLTHAIILLEQFLVYNADAFTTGVYLSGLLLWTAASLAATAKLISRLKQG